MQSPIKMPQSVTVDDFVVNWQARLTDAHLERLANQGFVVLDDVFTDKALKALQLESGSGEYQQASLTKGEQITHIRGDKTRWINQECVFGSHYLASIDQLAKLCNRLLYTGIQHSEAHYAYYPVGLGYQWHQDNPQGRHERILSAVFYLNDDWSDEDGGELSLIDLSDGQHHILPKANRLVLFQSDLMHQVEITNRQRHSIATWMRR